MRHALLSFLIFIVSCGPEKTARQRELDQLNKTVQENKANNDKLAGWYLGTISYMRGGKASEKVCLYLYSTSSFQDIPTRGETIELALLGAYIFIPGNPVAYTFNKSDYNTDEYVVRFTGETGATVRGNTLLELNVSANTLRGNFYAPNLVSGVEVKKSNREACLQGVF